VSYLVDTNVISELRKASRTDPNVSRWFAGVHDDDVFLSVLTLGELRQGVERIRRRDARAASRLERWLRGIVETFDERILQIDSRIAEEWGRMNVPNPLPVIDSLLAATAKIHSMTLVTRNTRDVVRTGVSCVNPFLEASSKE
jgi:predicted nucleic acid-binding protein